MNTKISICSVPTATKVTKRLIYDSVGVLGRNQSWFDPLFQLIHRDTVISARRSLQALVTMGCYSFIASLLVDR
jgi:hypothetical protein